MPLLLFPGRGVEFALGFGVSFLPPEFEPFAWLLLLLDFVAWLPLPLLDALLELPPELLLREPEFCDELAFG